MKVELVFVEVILEDNLILQLSNILSQDSQVVNLLFVWILHLPELLFLIFDGSYSSCHYQLFLRCQVAWPPSRFLYCLKSFLLIFYYLCLNAAPEFVPEWPPVLGRETSDWLMLLLHTHIPIGEAVRLAKHSAHLLKLLTRRRRREGTGCAHITVPVGEQGTCMVSARPLPESGIIDFWQARLAPAHRGYGTTAMSIYLWSGV